MKKHIIILLLAVGISAQSQTYNVITNLVATNYIPALSTNTLAVNTNVIDALQYRYTTWVCKFAGTNADTSGALKLYFRQTFDLAKTNYLTLTNKVFTLPVNGLATVCLETNFGEDWFSGWSVVRYELTGSAGLSNFNLWPVQKGYLKDR